MALPVENCCFFSNKEKNEGKQAIRDLTREWLNRCIYWKNKIYASVYFVISSAYDESTADKRLAIFR